MSGEVYRRTAEASTKTKPENGHIPEKLPTSSITASSVLYEVVVETVKTYLGSLVAKNILLWTLGLWGISDNCFQNLWDKLLDRIGEDRFTLMVILPQVVVLSIHWTLGSALTLMTYTNKPTFLRKYKVQPGTNEPMDDVKLVRVVLTVLRNQIMSFALAVIMIPSYGENVDLRILPPFYVAIFHVLVCAHVQELTFYYIHRMFHHKSIYKYVHKQHHEWTAPIAIISNYCSPFEHVLSNLFPVLLGVFLTNAHPSVATVWITLAVCVSLSDHSGYHLPFCPSPEYHDYHHAKFTDCFGRNGFLDRLHKTDENFLRSKAAPRNIALTSFESARDIFPDED